MITERVKEYYGKVLHSNKDLQTNACCNTDTIPADHKEILSDIEPEILYKFYGCGAPFPPVLEGLKILDLGCGTGRDVYLLSKLVGENGFIHGIDMTQEQLDVAEKYKNIQTKKYKYNTPNISFHKGYIEDLKPCGIKDNSIDLVVSNCVINLSPDKHSVFKEIFRVLKPGGEMYISDVFADRRIPQYLRDDPVLYGECLSGALYIEDFRRILHKIGCVDYRVVSKRPLEISNAEIQKKLGHIHFFSITLRAFKLDLEDTCEDYGQIAMYKGDIPTSQHSFKLDDHHVFEAGKSMLVCGNTVDMLQNTRYAKHFQIHGDKSTHFGIFDCSPTSMETSFDSNPTKGCC